jgi:AcrR family transcriptional regulator
MQTPQRALQNLTQWSINNQLVISRFNILARTPKSQTRNPEATQARILAAAHMEFAKKGLGGARVDEIASRAKSNKRMLYHYFGNKDALFRVTIENAYAEFREAEAALQLERLDPIAAMRRLVQFTWEYFLARPDFLTLVNSENLHKAKHLKASSRTPDMSRKFVERMKNLLQRGVDEGVFRKGLDAVQVNITIAAIGYYYCTNKYTGSIVFERDLMAKPALAERLKFNTSTILRLVCTPQMVAKLEAKGELA